MTDPLANYQSMTTKSRQQVLLAEYRCRPKGCLLLHVWQTPDGRYWYLPPYGLSPRFTDTLTVESARRKRTSEDGKWLPKAGSLDHLLDFCANETEVDGITVVTSYDRGSGLTVNCKHLRKLITAPELAADLANANPGAPVRIFVTSAEPKSG